MQIFFTHKQEIIMKKEGFKEKLTQYAIFAGPGMIIFLLVVAIPIFYGVYLTFTDWDGIARVKNFIGFENYVALFEDKEFWHSLYLTIKYVFISTIFINILAFFLAYELTQGVKGQNFLRAGFFTPNLIGGIILGFIWKFVFQRVTVQMYDIIPLEILKKSWLSSPETAFVSHNEFLPRGVSSVEDSNAGGLIITFRRTSE